MSGVMCMMIAGGDIPKLPATLTAQGTSAGLAQGTIRLNANGDIERILVDGGTTVIGKWLQNAANAGLWEAVFTVSTGALDIGSASVAQQLNTSRSWGRQNGASIVSCTGTLVIRPFGGGTNVASTNTGGVLLEADGSP